MGSNASFCPPNDSLDTSIAITECFAYLLEFLPPTFLFLVGIPCLVVLCRKATHEARHFPLQTTRWLLLFFLVLFTLAEWGQVLLVNLNRSPTPIGVCIAPLLSLAGLVFLHCLVHLADVKQEAVYLVLFALYWALNCAARVVFVVYISVSSNWTRDDIRPYTIYVITVLCVVAFFVDVVSYATICRRRHDDDDDDWPSDADDVNTTDLVFRDPYVNLYSKFTYYWVGKRLLRKGFKRPLQMSDLGKMPKTDSAKVAYETFREGWEKELAYATKKGKQTSMFRMIFRTFKKRMLYAALCLIVGLALQFYGPWAVNSIVIYAEAVESGTVPDYSDSLTAEEFFSNGFVVAVMVTLTTILSSVLSQWHHLSMFRLGIFFQTGLQSMIYEKSLRLSGLSSADSTVSTGSIMNFMSSDARQIMMFFFFMNMAWLVPIQLLVICGLLIGEMGLAAFIALLVIALTFPISAKLSAVKVRFQKKMLGFADERMKKVNELLQGIKLIKLYAWEGPLGDAIDQLRKSEVAVLLKDSLFRSVITFFTFSTPILLPLVAFSLYPVFSDSPLTAEKAFTSLALFNLLRAPLFLLPMLVSVGVAATASLGRVKEFFVAREIKSIDMQEEMREKQINNIDLARLRSAPKELQNGAEVEVCSGSFTWDPDSEAPLLHDIDIAFPKGKLSMIVGRVGSGKSSLLGALLGEMHALSGSVEWSEKDLPVAYCAQKPWILNTSLKDNILFGTPFNAERYRAVIDACSLQPDLDILPGGDETEIGEKGINLSGGQKQRVSVARALYSDLRVVMLDDPFSALDVHVGAHLFEKGIKGLLLNENRTVILATHHLQHLKEAHMIAVLKGGAILTSGSYGDVARFDGNLARQLSESESMDDVESEDSSQADDETARAAPSLSKQMSTKSQVPSVQGKNERETKKEKGKLTTKEERETGAVSWRHYWAYVYASGVFLFLVAMSFAFAGNGLLVAKDFWLSRWSTDNTSDPNATTVQYYVSGFALLSTAAILATLVFSVTFAFVSVTAAKNLHHAMLVRIVQAPMRFFDTTPVGRILNRFSSDTKILDQQLPWTIETMTQTFGRVVASFIVQSVVTVYFLIIGLPVLVVFYLIQRYFRTSSREIQRLESISRSPVFAHFSEVLGGLSTIRAYRWQNHFRTKLHSGINKNALSFLFLQTANRWLGTRLDFLGAIVVLSASISSLLVAVNGQISPGLVGLSVTYSLSTSIMLNWLVRVSTETENHMNCVERLQHYSRLDIEPQPSSAVANPPQAWPKRGCIEFKNVSARYSQDSGVVLHSIDTVIKDGEKIGICGRTGSGKSSLTLSLFRLVDIFEGSIVLDGVDIAQVALPRLRSSIAIIPQDPVLFTGTVRYNLDPFGHWTDERLWEVLDIAQLKSLVSDLKNGLESNIAEGGENFSVGERQLFCLARALLRQSRILVLDEATASVDAETDAIVQKVIRSAFSDKTVLTVAHRVATIMDSDRLLVLDEGKVIENDSPENLLENSESLFASLVNNSQNN